MRITDLIQLTLSLPSCLDENEGTAAERVNKLMGVKRLSEYVREMSHIHGLMTSIAKYFSHTVCILPRVGVPSCVNRKL